MQHTRRGRLYRLTIVACLLAAAGMLTVLYLLLQGRPELMYQYAEFVFAYA